MSDRVTPYDEDGAMTTMTISCQDCAMLDTVACGGCVVSFICEHEPGDAVVIDVAEARAVRMLGRSGLVPPLRHQLRTGCA